MYAFRRLPLSLSGRPSIGLASAAHRRARLLADNPLDVGQRACVAFEDASVTEGSDLSPEAQISRYLELAQEARKNAKSPYSALYAALPPDPQTTMLSELAIVYLIVGILLFLAAVISAVQGLFANSAARAAT